MSNILKGENLHIFVVEGELNGTASTNLVPLALANSCSLNINVDSFDVTTKDSGSWKASLPGMKSWDMSSSNLYCPDYDKLVAVMLNRTKIHMYWCASANTEANNEVTHTPDLNASGSEQKYYVGEAYISSISASANNGEASNYDVSFTGTGALSASNTLPTIGIGVDQTVLNITQGNSAQVIVHNYTGTLSATCSDANTTATIANGVVTISVGAAATAGGSYVTISDSGTGTSTIVYVTIIAA